ncbi:hypothetical protein KUCAC02_003420 [Chaenocephalus aceratus]|uniref:Uncharacterized protein n=1 Tax=Chaenocephalus aceratus TaxID=36190 RepID=A0ACB9WL87_CHAAC|nr:hypothetical protein KUCAC02_003420 [Chaenocephalus aceratus]
MEMDRKTIATVSLPCAELQADTRSSPKDLKETLDSEWRMTGGGGGSLVMTHLICGGKTLLTKVIETSL